LVDIVVEEGKWRKLDEEGEEVVCFESSSLEWEGKGW